MLLLIFVLILLFLPDLRFSLGTRCVWADPIMIVDGGRPDLDVDIFALVKDVLTGADGRGRAVDFFVISVAGSHDVGGMHWYLV